MGYDILEEVDKLASVVDNAVKTGDYSDLKKNVGEIVEPMKRHGYDNRFFDGKNRGSGQSGNAYQGGNAYQSGAYRYGRQGSGANRNTRGMNNSGPYYGGPRGYNAGHMENRGNAFYGSYSSGGSNQGYGANAPTRGGRPQGPSGSARQADPLTGETELFRKVENSLGDQVKQVIGFMGAISAGFVALIMVAATIGLMIEGMSAGASAVAIIFSLFSLGITAAFVNLILNGRKGIERMKRYVRYRAVLMKKSFASVKELAEKTNIPEEKVVKELKELTALGFFKQGHFDKKETTFICADEVYRYYQQSEETEKIRRQEEEERRKRADYIPEDVLQLLDKGNEYVKKIHDANEKIPDAEVSEKLDRMENIVARIFVEVQKNPDLARNLNMFMDYYLPTTTKLMDAYVEMDANPVQGENIQNSKREIEETLDTVNDAFENLLNSFFHDKALDLSTDISVMKNLMRQQGLTPDDLELVRRQQEAELAGSPTIGEMQEAMRDQEVSSGFPTLEEIRRQLAEEDARAARMEKENAAASERPLSFDEQLELEAEQGLLMTGNGSDDDIF